MPIGCLHRGLPTVDWAVHRRRHRRSWIGQGQRKGANFTGPVLVAEVEYRAWADDGKLRHASVKGIRQREDEAGVFALVYEKH
ncbi:ATP dependent DNA ligase [Sinorhizobium meliloti]|uniref:ATP dependent DNA ligase n=1 Tax=Rhizobium meliloti TaxID=382 RepID=UPI002D7673C9|nr:hypothetical protein [Sinorhizobium meliloti]